MTIWDALAQALDDAPKARPDGSVTIEDFVEEAARRGTPCTQLYAERALRKKCKAGELRAVSYLAGGRRRQCYVVDKV